MKHQISHIYTYLSFQRYPFRVFDSGGGITNTSLSIYALLVKRLFYYRLLVTLNRSELSVLTLHKKCLWSMLEIPFHFSSSNFPQVHELLVLLLVLIRSQLVLLSIANVAINSIDFCFVHIHKHYCLSNLQVHFVRHFRN